MVSSTRRTTSSLSATTAAAIAAAAAALMVSVAFATAQYTPATPAAPGAAAAGAAAGATPAAPYTPATPGAAGAAPSVPAGPLDIAQLGAKGDGTSDSTAFVLQAWKNACNATGTQKIVIPPGNYLTGALNLKGPCTSSIILRLDGNLLGTGDLNAYKTNWIEVEHVDNFAINGHGIIDGQGPLVWTHNQCNKNYNCKILPNSLVIDYSTNVTVRGITLKNSKFFHLNIYESKNVVIDKVTITSPGDSPNTDGIHVGDSTNITISSTTIAAGDDCISIGPGTKMVRVNGVRCGPGHGISVGSLGRYKDEKDVEDIIVTNCTIKGTTNGLRIKSYEDSKSQLRATKFLYDGITMDNVSYPIIIDQKYCPNNICSASGTSKVAVTDIVFKNIVGTSATPEAVTLNCANNLPCQGIQLHNVDLKYAGQGNTTLSVCKNVAGKSSNVAKELACV
ncbi:exopolygalacturonase [Oryza sativa Japonica Group]|uniref:Exopolygalacturonase n=5 Tax=Oryza TaxID=4527 RepID=A0A2H4MZA4_ORYSJ|nr:exopolygalacturonase [Oryza sativa Japonica Group]ATS17261.1 exopolygalacturonase [Oryza sativa Japonica Group]BAF08108.1 Os02g0196700 [Oryza sativa Japonica Group]|eukprot:NP_001046194.1 Os02g0196700 [Oryza sativa Japonica Group]